ncbi:MAG: FHA domain-containing protein [Proteobacteria bacterium]|nr:FHA domain-containing protein [Pseudomonadota bacterium]
MAELIGQEGARVLLRHGLVFGRDPGCSVPLNDPRCSRRHAEIRRSGDGWEVVDLNSRNGTFVDDEPIERVVLVDGQRLRVGRTEWAVRIAPERKRRRTLIGEIDAPDDVSLGEPVALEVRASLDEAERLRSPSSGQGSRLSAILQVAESLSRLRDPQDLVDHALDRIVAVFPDARLCAIMLDGEDGLGIASAHARRGESNVHLSDSVVEMVRSQGRSVLCRDPLLDAELGTRQSIIHSGIAALLASPLIVDGRFLGMLYVDTDRSDKAFAESDLQLFSALAAILAVAVHNTHLVEQAKREAQHTAQLARYLSPDLAKRVAQGEMDLNPGGEMRHGTVFFSDLVGFTPLSERLRPLDLVDLLNRYFGRMEDVLFAHEGTLDKYQGDAIMAFWGVLTECADPEGAAVLSAIRMQRALYCLNGELEPEHRLAMGIGLATGQFVGCHLGTQRKVEFTVIGDTVNLGARIEGKSGRNRIMVDPVTAQGLEGRLAGVRFAPTPLKGKSQSLELVSVRGLDNGSGSMDLCMPVAVGGVSGCLAVQGRLAESGEAILDVLHTKNLGARDVVALRAEVPELAISPLRARVSVTMEESPGVRRTRLIASTAAGWADLLRPGTMLPAACEVTELPRG